MPDLLWRPEAPIEHRMIYQTEVLRSRSGTEMRIAHRDVPRQTITLQLRIDQLPDVRKWRTYLFQDINSAWRVPLWWEGEAITSAVSAAGQTWPMSMTYNDLVVGDDVWIERHDGTGEAFTVDQVNAGDIHTDAGATAGFPKGSHVYKIENVVLRDQPSVSRNARGHDVITCVFDIDPPVVVGGGGASVSTHQQAADAAAYTLLDKTPVDVGPISGEFLASLTRTGNSAHNFNQFGLEDPARIVERRRYAIDNRADLQYWEKFAEAVLGMREPLYTPTFRDDLIVDTQPIAPWTSFKVADESDDVTNTFDYAGQYWPHSSHASLMLETDQGVQYREVTGATDNADGTVTLTVAALTASSVISKISFLERCRLASDEIIFTHTGRNRGFVDIAVTTVQRHPDE